MYKDVCPESSWHNISITVNVNYLWMMVDKLNNLILQRI